MKLQGSNTPGDFRLRSGGKPRRCKVTCEQVKQIKQLRAKGWTLQQLKDEFNLAIESVRQISSGLSYKHCGKK